ncbi:hypothetical protein GYMLUDRAFT_63063 [Collybiopsis luxurians FD-317 M1]|uniref:Uncharacterized protein n=1 Tax=Collybiopsis luxurians FD-317 M1 TaxID=944289 RepID=A0A0D0AVV0_9AGAR|nr:hypothetical protein GYMLUDRAFT_63063 [Collybiopsis luxurians FD-317 M1]
MTQPGSYLESLTSTHSLPCITATAPERAKALLGIIQTAIRKGQVTSLDLQRFTACAEPKHQASNHSLNVGLVFSHYVLHQWMAKEKCIFLPCYIKWLVNAGNSTSLQTLQDNLPSILEADASDSLLSRLIVCIVWCLQHLLKTLASSQTSASSTPHHSRSDLQYDSESPILRVLGKHKAGPTTSISIPYKCPHILPSSSSSSPSFSGHQLPIGHERGQTGPRLSSQLRPWSINGLTVDCDLIYAAATDANLKDPHATQAMVELAECLELV